MEILTSIDEDTNEVIVYVPFWDKTLILPLGKDEHTFTTMLRQGMHGVLNYNEFDFLLTGLLDYAVVEPKEVH